MNKTVTLCDACGHEIAGHAYEFGGFVATVNGARREVVRTVETCSRRCLIAIVNAMLGEVSPQ